MVLNLDERGWASTPLSHHDSAQLTQKRPLSGVEGQFN